MNVLLLSTLMGLGIGGGGIGLGGLVALVAYGAGGKRERLAWLLMAVSAGMIFSLLLFELLPESISTGGHIAVLSGMILGILFISIVERIFHRVTIVSTNPHKSLLINTALIIALGIAIHNLPVGFAMGSGMVNQPNLGFEVATAMLFHNFPEGLAVSLSLIIAGINRLFIPIITCVVSLPAGLGAFLGANLGNVHVNLLSFFFGIAIGTILFVTWHEVLGQVRKQLRLKLLLPCMFCGLLAGKLFTLFI